MDKQAIFLPVNVLDVLAPLPSGVVHGGGRSTEESAERFAHDAERWTPLQAIRLAEIEQMPTEQAIAALETLSTDVEQMMAEERDA